MNKDPVIKVENVSKIYKLYDKPIDRLKEAINPFGKKCHKEFYALNNVTFDVRKGETIGIIGKNGSGKSTLLQVITGVLTPTSGTVYANGKISALLELGAGFNPELTGIENIYLNGIIKGYCKEEMDIRLDKIISFADIGEYIYQPVKTYSSGMFARVAFAVAINVNPDILIIDEALSVGDMQFQEKSINRMKKFKEHEKSILFVTHSLPSIRNFCDRAIWLDKGKIKMDGTADIVCSSYQSYIKQKEELIQINEINDFNREISKIYIKNVKTDKSSYKIDDEINIDIELEFKEKIVDYGVSIIVYNSSGKMVTLFNTVRDDIYFENILDEIRLSIPENDFVQDTYYISAFISDEMAMFPYNKKEFIASFSVETKKNKRGIPIAEGYFRSKHKWVY